MESLLQQASCSICRSIYREPKTISCLHTFCCGCLTKHAETNHRQGKFRCPDCQTEIDLPEGNRFDKLPTSHFHNNLLSVLAVQQSANGRRITCSNCESYTSNACYCFDCAKFMCPTCLHAHEVLKVFRGHKVTLAKFFQDDDYEAVLKRQPFCKEEFHEQEVTRFFCLRCQTCVCHICIAMKKHEDHGVVLLDEAAENEKDTIKTDIARIRETENTLNNVIRQFEETIAKLEHNIATAKCGVSQAAEQMITKIREHEQEVIYSLETTRVTRIERINRAIEEVKLLIKQMNQAVEFAENLSHRSSSSDILLSKETLKKRFEQLCGADIPKHHMTSFIKFKANEECFKLGDIATEGADATCSTLEGLDQIFQAGVEAELTLCIKTPEGEVTNYPGLRQQIEVLVQPSKYDPKVILAEMENGTFKVLLTPKVPGAYSIEVKINGENLPNCPSIVQVKEREIVVVGELDLKLFPDDKLKGPYGIAVNTKGEIALADRDARCVYLFDKEGNCLTKIGGQRRKNKVQLNHPCGVTFLNDNEILITDSRIQVVDVQTETLLKSLKVTCPIDVCVDEQSRIIVTESGENTGRINVMSISGETISMFGDSGLEKLTDPRSCIPYKNIFLVSDGNSNSIKVFNDAGSFLYKFGTEGEEDGQFDLPSDLELDRSNNLLVCDYYNSRVQQFSVDGYFTGKTVTNLPFPDAIATAPDGRILVTSAAAKKVYILK